MNQANSQIEQENKHLLVDRDEGNKESNSTLLIEALSTAHLGIWEWEVHQPAITWSAELYTMYGVTPQEYSPSYEGYLQKIHPDDRTRVHNVITRVLADPNSFSQDERILRPDGELAYLRTWGHPVLDESGKVIRLVAICQNITESKLNEIKIQEAERFRSIIFDTVGDVLYYLGVEPDDKFRFLSINDAFSLTTGLSQDRVIGHLVDEILPEPALGMALERYRRAIQERRSIRWDEVSVYPAGTKHGEVTVTPLFGEDGHCVGLVGTVHDITERVEAEAETHRTLTILNAVIEGTTDAIYVKDVNGLYLMINTAGARFYGRPIDEIIGKTDGEILPAETAAAFLAVDQLAKKSGVTQVYEETGHLGGSDRTLLTAKGPYLDAEGRVIGVIGISRDITERRLVEEQNIHYASRFKFLSDASRTFVEARFDLAAILDETARRAADYFQDACIVRLFSENKTQIKTAVFHCIDPEAQAAMREVFAGSQAFLDAASINELLNTGKPVWITVTPDQARSRISEQYWPILERFPVHTWLIVPLLEAGKITGTITVFRFRAAPAYSADDEALLLELAERASLSIGNALLYDKAQRAIRLREDFMAIASHELKTPLTPLKMQLQLLNQFILKDGTIAPDSKASGLVRLIADSEQQINRLTRLVDDMLDVTQIQSGHLGIHRESVDLEHLISGVVERHRHAADAVNSPIKLSVGAVPQGQWDGSRIEQAVSNLLSNAIKYGAGKPIEVNLTQQENQAVLTVQDKGDGICLEDQGRIFKPFERDASIQHFGGLGLGLYISNQIAESHGGRLWMNSEPGNGALFTLELPLQPPNTAP